MLDGGAFEDRPMGSTYFFGWSGAPHLARTFIYPTSRGEGVKFHSAGPSSALVASKLDRFVDTRPAAL